MLTQSRPINACFGLNQACAQQPASLTHRITSSCLSLQRDLCKSGNTCNLCVTMSGMNKLLVKNFTHKAAISYIWHHLEGMHPLRG